MKSSLLSKSSTLSISPKMSPINNSEHSNTNANEADSGDEKIDPSMMRMPLDRLASYLTSTKKTVVFEHLNNALKAYEARDWQLGIDEALKALKIDEKCGEAWHFLAVAREKFNDLTMAFTCYETALSLMPDNIFIANDIGRMAFRLEQHDVAVKLFQFILAKEPDNIDAINNLCSSLRELDRLDDVIEILKQAISKHPTSASLWNTIGTVMTMRGESLTAKSFFEEALRHDPNHLHAIHNLGNLKADMGDYDTGIKLLRRSIPLFIDELNIASAKLGISFCYLAKGDLKRGWETYTARHKKNTLHELHFICHLPRWDNAKKLPEKGMFISSEQGLGDEIMFASILPDLLRSQDDNFQWALAVEPRLVPIFKRSFPQCLITPHRTTKKDSRSYRQFLEVDDWSQYDSWTVMADFFPKFRGKIDQFPKENIYLKPDIKRVEHWKQMLNSLNSKPKVGVLWKSLIMHSRRSRHFSPFETWKILLQQSDIQCVNLQYGDISEEIEIAKKAGIDLWIPPEIDLKNDLDDVAALCVALDCVTGTANATTNLASACGANVWLLGEEFDWTRLGTRILPWYPKSKLFISEDLYQWDRIMKKMSSEMIEDLKFTKSSS